MRTQGARDIEEFFPKTLQRQALLLHNVSKETSTCSPRSVTQRRQQSSTHAVVLLDRFEHNPFLRVLMLLKPAAADTPTNRRPFDVIVSFVLDDCPTPSSCFAPSPRASSTMSLSPSPLCSSTTLTSTFCASSSKHASTTATRRSAFRSRRSSASRLAQFTTVERHQEGNIRRGRRGPLRRAGCNSMICRRSDSVNPIPGAFLCGLVFDKLAGDDTARTRMPTVRPAYRVFARLCSQHCRRAGLLAGVIPYISVSRKELLLIHLAGQLFPCNPTRPLRCSSYTSPARVWTPLSQSDWPSFEFNRWLLF